MQYNLSVLPIHKPTTSRGSRCTSLSQSRYLPLEAENSYTNANFRNVIVWTPYYFLTSWAIISF
jgi:hypothetical protein